MNITATKPRLAAGLVLASLSVAALGAALPVSQDVIEARQETQIWTTYALSPYLRANDLKVAVHDGKALLRGRVEEKVNRELAEQIALGVAGVTAVDNQIVVASSDVSTDKSVGHRYGEAIDDATMTALVKSKIAWSRHTSGLSTKVETLRGRVTLTGTADSAASRDFAGMLALHTRGVKAVDNQLTVSADDPSLIDDAAQSLRAAGNEVADSWITAKVKSTFLYSSNVDGADIAVSTLGGVVTLSGRLDSGAERALAIELASNVRGVKSVESVALIL